MKVSVFGSEGEVYVMVRDVGPFPLNARRVEALADAIRRNLVALACVKPGSVGVCWSDQRPVIGDVRPDGHISMIRLGRDA